MKTLIAILLAGSIGFAAAYFIVSNQNDAALKSERAKMEAQWQAEKTQLQKDLAAAKNKKATVEQVATEVPVATKRSAKEILDNLLKLQPAGATRIATIRKIVHELEDLTELGNAAVPDIRDFLAQNSDLDYSTERTDRGDRSDRSSSTNRSDRSDRRSWTPPWQRTSPPTEFTLPPSLRIGLFDVLKGIGTPEAEQVMASVLGTSGRAVEVAYLTRSLEEIAPGKYREIATASAKDLLRNPITINSPNRLDEEAEGYLFGVLELYNDASFVEDAKKMLVGADGRLDRNAQSYLTKMQGSNMVATYYDLYKNEALTNNFDKMSVANRILDYVGTSPQANTFLNEVVANTNIDSRMRSFAVMRLAGGFGGMDSPTDPNVINARIQLLQSMANMATDDRIAQTLDMTLQNLQNLKDGKPIENPYSRNRGDRSSRSRDRGGQTSQAVGQ